MKSNIRLRGGIVGLLSSVIAMPIIWTLRVFGSDFRVPCGDGVPSVWLLPQKGHDTQWMFSQRETIQRVFMMLRDDDLTSFRLLIKRKLKWILIGDFTVMKHYPYSKGLIIAKQDGITTNAVFLTAFLVGICESVKFSWFHVRIDDDAQVAAQKRFLATRPEFAEMYKWAFDERGAV